MQTRSAVLSVSELKGVEVIDGGDTLAVRFETPDGGELALLVPQRTVATLTQELAVGLAARREPPRES
ncbi:hypothetical protein [Methylobacterium iners]|jgi:hypothetical protein|uniref:Uncharacterized protein n=1 Tax=Methylobacterium iners TaxID=418707 RepID=A0ABQ4RXW0_9HYPH|nr:hypothetical protein [Methylobacterium iners]GJD95675.1 hypothetical protein OCOJLMKI_2889 [Methylobacterium iners]